jgi:hypothetical protein
MNLNNLNLFDQWEILECYSHEPSVSCVSDPKSTQNNTIIWFARFVDDNEHLKNKTKSVILRLECVLDLYESS